MTDVEQKVVQMRFDDKEFDEKARKTMKTLDKLNEKLSFDAVAKKSDAALNDMVDNVEKIADKAYTIVDRVIDKIKDSIATNIFNFISDTIVGQVKTGWQKYADMTQAVGTLAAQGHKMENINKVLERLSFFSDETNYNFNSMLNNIGKFTAAGVKLEDAEQALEGIAGMAGLSGVNAQRASVAMDQMAQAMGSYLKKADWVSIQTANLDTMDFRQTLIDTAVDMGTLKKTAKGTYVSLRASTSAGQKAFNAQTGFLESLTQGAWATTDVMVETYKKYGAAVSNVYDKVEQDGGTASEAINDLTIDNKKLLKEYTKQYNVTEDIAEQELNKISLIRKATDEEIAQYAELHKVSKKVAEATLNSNYDKMLKDWQTRTKKTLKETEEELDHWAGWTNSKALKAFTNAQEARTFEDVINSIKEAVSSNWRSIYTSIFGDYAEAKKLWTDMANGLVDLFAGRLYEIAAMFKTWKGLDVGKGGRTDLWQGLYAFAYGIRDIIKEVREVWDSLISDGESGISVLQNITLKIKEAGFRFYTFVHSLIDEDFFADITEALHNIKTFIDQIFGAFYQGVRDAVPGGEFFKGLLLDFAHVFKELTSNFKLSDEAVDGLRRTFKGLTIILNKTKKTFVEVLVKIVLPVLNAVFSVLGQVVEVVVTITGAIGDILEYFIPLDSETNSLVKILGFLTEVLTELIKLIGTGITWVLKKIVPLIGVAIGSVAGLASGIANLFNGKTIKISSNNALYKGFDGLKAKILETWAPLKTFSETIDEYKNGKGLTNFLNLFADITDGIGNRLLLTLDATVGFLEVMSESKFGKALGYAIKALRLVIRAGLWLFNNLFLPVLKEIITELGLTIESVKGIIDERGILGLLDLIQEVFKTGIFGSLVSTINLINSVIGSNGVGKLFSKGAKALESIASYFNAAKMNQAAEVMLKIVAAMGLLYTLLALITFLPVENYEKMKEALVDFGIALGIVVGGVFIISAAAALAGGNLIAMAAGFIGVAVAITTALWALNAMVEWIEEVDVKIIEKGLEKLKGILDVYSWFIIKSIAPLALFAGKMNADVGGVGIAMAGLAASIWLLIKALSGIDQVNVEQLDKLFEFLSGIYVVLAAATALMLFGAQGKNVHGISIAIASIGVAFAAIKMILPLCKDIAEQKDMFMDAQSALATFGMMMLAFSASMYFVTSGVHGLISGIASILLFRAYIAILSEHVIPLIKIILNEIIVLSEMLMGLDLFENKRFAIFIGVFVAIGALLFEIAHNFRWIFGLWSEFDPLAAVAICLTVLGSLIAFAKLVVPAIGELNAILKKNTDIQNAELFRMVVFLFLPVLVIMGGFALIINKYVDMYNKAFRNNKLFSINVGLVAKEFNGAASIMNSIMVTIVGLYAAMAGLVWLISKSNITKRQIDFMNQVLGGTLAVILATLIPLAVIFATISKRINDILDPVGQNNFSILGGIIGKRQSTAATVFTSIANALMTVTVALPIFMVALIGLSHLINQYGGIDTTIKLIEQVTDSMTRILLMLSLLTFIMASPLLFKKLQTGTSLETINGDSKIPINNLFATFNTFAKDVAWIVLGLSMLFSIITLETMQAASLKPEQFKQFEQAIDLLGDLLGGTILAISAFVFLVSWVTNKYSKGVGNITKGGDSLTLGYFTPTINILIAMVGVVGSIIAIGAALLPAIKALETMDISKIMTIFSQVILVMGVAIIGMIASLAIGFKNITNKGSAIIGLINSVVIIVGPLVMMAIILGQLSDAINAMHGVDSDSIEALSDMMSSLKWLILIVGALGLVAGAAPTLTAGIAVVAVLCLSIGAMAALIAYAAREIYKVWYNWQGLQKVAGKLASYQDGWNMNSGMAEGLADSSDLVENELKKEQKNYQGIVDTVNKSGSPSKVYADDGKNIDLGLAQGIKRNTKSVIREISALANITHSVFEDELEIASPSKVFYKNGRFIVAGIDEGVNSKKSSLSDTMNELGENMINSFNSAFENFNVDIWGGKDPIETIKEGLSDIDAGSIIGKMLGLEDNELTDAEKAQLKAWQDELDAINAEGNKYGTIDANMARRASWLQNQIETLTKPKSLGEKIASKAWNGVKDFLNSDTVKELGKELGIDVSDGLTLNLFGEDGKSGVLGETIEKIKNGQWTELGTTIGSAVGSSLKNAIMNILGPTGHKLLSWANIVDANAYDIMQTAPKPSSDSDTILGIGLRRLDMLNSQLSSETQKKLRDLFGSADINEIHFSPNFNTDDLINALNEDLGPRMEQFVNAIIEGGYTAIKDEEGNMQFLLTYEAREAITKLMKLWGVASPSKVMKYIYSMVGEGAVEGIEDKIPAMNKAFDDATSEQYRELSLGLQALDQLASSEDIVAQPRLVPILDTSNIQGYDSFLTGDSNAKISASLDYTGSLGSIIAASQLAVAGAIDSLKRDILNSLNIGELVRVNVGSTPNDSNLFDHFINIERQEYNRTGQHAW